MSGVGRWVAGMSVLLAMMVAGTNRAAGQATTTVQDTVYSADGMPAEGTVLVSWGAFTTAGGQSRTRRLHRWGATTRQCFI
jgi:hypothetical protein